MTTLTGEQFMRILLDRQAEYAVTHSSQWLPLLEWFIQPGDEDLFTPPPATGQPRRARTPRTYESAAYWQMLRNEAQDDLDHLTATIGMPERAAATGEGIGAARAAHYHASLDRAVARGAELSRRIASLDHKIRRAEAREAKS